LRQAAGTPRRHAAIQQPRTPFCCADRLLANKQKRGKKLIGSQVLGVEEVMLASRAAGTGT